MIKGFLRWARVTLSGSDSLPFAQQQVGYLGKAGDTVVVEQYGVHGNIPVDTAALLAHVVGDGDKAVIGVLSPNRDPMAPGELEVYHPPTGTRIYFRASGALEIDTTRASGSITITTGGGPVSLDTGGGSLTAIVGAATVTATSADVTSPTVNVTAATSVSVTTPTMSVSGDLSVGGGLSVTGAGGATVSGSMSIGGTLTSTGDATIAGRGFLGHTHSGVAAGSNNTGEVN